MEPQDALLNLIRRLVAQRVPPHQQEQFVQVVAITIAQLMGDPRFLTELSVVRELQARIAHLTNENVLLKQTLSQRVAAPRKAAAPRKRAPTKAATQAFQAGVRDLRR